MEMPVITEKPSRKQLLSTFQYFALSLLYALPVIGLVFLFIFQKRAEAFISRMDKSHLFIIRYEPPVQTLFPGVKQEKPEVMNCPTAVFTQTLSGCANVIEYEMLQFTGSPSDALFQDLDCSLKAFANMDAR